MEGVFTPKIPIEDVIAEEIKDEEECKLATCVQEIATAMFRLIFQFGEKGFLQREFILYLRGLMAELTGKDSSVNQQSPAAPRKTLRFPSPAHTREPSPTRPHPVTPNRNEMNDTQEARRRLFSSGQPRSASDGNLCQPLSDSGNTTAGSGLGGRHSRAGSPPRDEFNKSSRYNSPDVRPSPLATPLNATYGVQSPVSGRRLTYDNVGERSPAMNETFNCQPLDYSPRRGGWTRDQLSPDVRPSPLANLVQSPVSRRRLTYDNMGDRQWILNDSFRPWEYHLLGRGWTGDQLRDLIPVIARMKSSPIAQPRTATPTEFMRRNRSSLARRSLQP